MTNLDYLKQPRWMEEDINADLEDLKIEKQRAETLSATHWGEERVVGGPAKANALFETHTDNIALLEEQIRKKQETLIKLRAQVREVLRQVRNPIRKRVMIARYLGYQALKEIAESQFLSFSYVRSVLTRETRKIHLPENIIIVTEEEDKWKL